jgi:hypothetical protein
VHVRIAPYTLPARFRGWSTTLDAAGAVLRAAENLGNNHGLMSDWVTPHPAGGSIEVPHTDPAPHTDRWTHADAYARVVIDGMGLSGAALKLEAPPPQNLRRQFDVDQIARTLILPVIRAAAAVLGAGEFIGRCRGQIDLVGVQHVAMLESQSDHQAVDDWVPSTIDITLTASDDELVRAALTAARPRARPQRRPGLLGLMPGTGPVLVAEKHRS